MHQCVGYTDYALKRFFNESKNSDWFKNTVFIFTADHGNQSYYPYYEKIINRFASPIMIYKPGSDLIGIEKTLASHMDVFPTILDVAGIDSKGINVDGISLIPHVVDKEKNPQRPIFWEMENQKAVRKGKWKLVFPHVYRSYEGVVPGVARDGVVASKVSRACSRDSRLASTTRRDSPDRVVP